MLSAKNNRLIVLTGDKRLPSCSMETGGNMFYEKLTIILCLKLNALETI